MLQCADSPKGHRHAPARQPIILLAEDDDSLRKLLVKALDRSGYKVASARNAQEALRVAETLGAIDLLISDVDMPDISGPALAEMLAAGLPPMKVILMSGRQSSAVVTHPEWLFLEKPFALHGLIERIASLCRPPDDASSEP